jgi:hypothetical protein
MSGMCQECGPAVDNAMAQVEHLIATESRDSVSPEKIKAAWGYVEKDEGLPPVISPSLSCARIFLLSPLHIRGLPRILKFV